MTSFVRVLCAAAFLLAVPACDGPQPLGPTPLDKGIVVFIHSGYRGPSPQVCAAVADLTHVEGPCNVGEAGGSGTWDNCISSIRLLPGYYARIYGDRDFRGAVLEVTQDIPDLGVLHGDCSGSYDDCISSIRVLKRP